MRPRTFLENRPPTANAIFRAERDQCTIPGVRRSEHCEPTTMTGSPGIDRKTILR